MEGSGVIETLLGFVATGFIYIICIRIVSFYHCFLKKKTIPLISSAS